MAYEAGCTKAPRVNIFSNPDRNYGGIPQGSPTENNARAIREAAVSGSRSNMARWVGET